MNIKKGSLGYYDKIQNVISDNIMKWVDDEGAMEMNEIKLDSYLKNKAAQLMNIPIVTDGAIADISGGNKLRETVGGLEGILSVVKSVSTGVYDIEAGAKLISSLYDVSIEEAKQWIGTPSITNASELNKAEKLL